jgi:hypothetical protein
LIPLHATRSDVEKLLGQPTDTTFDRYFYKFTDEGVEFRYAKGNCDPEDLGWKVPADTVLEIAVVPYKTVLLSDLDLDVSAYERFEYSHTQVIYYSNHREGVMIQTRFEKVVNIKYSPSSRDLKMACPEKK